MNLTDWFDTRGNKRNRGQFFIGGNKPSVPKAPKPPKMPKAPDPINIPAPPAPPPPPPPPSTVSALDASQAAADTKTQAARRRGMSKTLIAGESPGGNALSPANPGQRKTLLG